MYSIIFPSRRFPEKAREVEVTGRTHSYDRIEVRDLYDGRAEIIIRI